MTQSPTGGPAQTTYQVASRAGVVGHDAQRVVIVTDGRPAEGGPQQSVYFVSDAEIAAGDFIVTGNKPLPIVQVGAAGVEYPPIAVYDVTGKPDDVQPPQNPIAPQFSAAEVGAVNASTVAVTFDLDVSATGDDYSSGVTIQVNGSTRNFESGIRQANHALVYYALATPAQGEDTVTWEYSAAAGSIVSESDGAPLADVTAQNVTNNIPDLIGDALRADAVAYWKMSDVSDSAGHITNLTNNNSASFVAGKVGNAVSLNGSSQFLSHAPSASLNIIGTSFSVAFWFKLSDTAGSPELIHLGTDSHDQYYIYSDSGASRVFFFLAPDYEGANSTVPIQPDQWYFVVVQDDIVSKITYIQVNNEAIVSKGYANNPTSTGPDSLYIGAWAGLGNFANGMIDEILFIKRVLSVDECNYLYNSGAGRALFG